MPDFVVRILIVVGVVVVAWALVSITERRGKRTSGLQPGITVVTTPTCAICPETVNALRARDGSVLLHLLDASDPRAAVVRATTAPTVVVADEQGREILRRTGRATVTDAARIIAMAQAGAAPGTAG